MVKRVLAVLGPVFRCTHTSEDKAKVDLNSMARKAKWERKVQTQLFTHNTLRHWLSPRDALSCAASFFLNHISFSSLWLRSTCWWMVFELHFLLNTITGLNRQQTFEIHSCQNMSMNACVFTSYRCDIMYTNVSTDAHHEHLREFAETITLQANDYVMWT